MAVITLVGTDPSSAAANLGMPLLDGLGRSTQLVISLRFLGRSGFQPLRCLERKCTLGSGHSAAVGGVISHHIG